MPLQLVLTRPSQQTELRLIILILAQRLLLQPNRDHLRPLVILWHLNRLMLKTVVETLAHKILQSRVYFFTVLVLQFVIHADSNVRLRAVVRKNRFFLASRNRPCSQLFRQADRRTLVTTSELMHKLPLLLMVSINYIDTLYQTALLFKHFFLAYRRIIISVKTASCLGFPQLFFRFFKLNFTVRKAN